MWSKAPDLDAYSASSIIDLLHVFYGKYSGLAAEFTRQSGIIETALSTLTGDERTALELALKGVQDDALAAERMLEQCGRFRNNRPTDERLREWLVTRIASSFDWRYEGEVLF